MNLRKDLSLIGIGGLLIFILIFVTGDLSEHTTGIVVKAAVAHGMLLLLVPSRIDMDMPRHLMLGGGVLIGATILLQIFEATERHSLFALDEPFLSSLFYKLLYPVNWFYQLGYIVGASVISIGVISYLLLLLQRSRQQQHKNL